MVKNRMKRLKESYDANVVKIDQLSTVDAKFSPLRIKVNELLLADEQKKQRRAADELNDHFTDDKFHSLPLKTKINLKK